MASKTELSGQSMAQVVVRSLVNQGVRHIFGIPGGKIMPFFDVLRTEGPELIVCRHEQNAAFMAAATGGVAVATPRGGGWVSSAGLWRQPRPKGIQWWPSVVRCRYRTL